MLPHSEGLQPPTAPDALDALWAKHSLRSLALTWNHETDYGVSCYGDAAAPLKPAGRLLVRALERAPSCSIWRTSTTPGSSTRSTRTRRRSSSRTRSAEPCRITPAALADEQLRALGEHGGLVGLAFDPDFLGRGSVDEALRHIDRIATLAGEDSVSIGSDWGVALMGEIGDPVALSGLVDAIDDTYGRGLAEKFAFANAYGFLRAQLPLSA